ncbi:MAG: S1C family serine protease [Gammaproteobacteria bacterium]|nr:S1C family serine protease [Gammaproteobacteria bacterium]
MPLIVKQAIAAIAMVGIIAIVIYAASDGVTTSPFRNAAESTTTDNKTSPEPPAEPPFLTDDESNNIAIYRDVSPSVVFVTNTQIRQNIFSLNATEVPQGSGTGFVWDESGLIVTNFHVVFRANKVTITTASGKV